jgi:hypothetical protein
MTATILRFPPLRTQQEQEAMDLKVISMGLGFDLEGYPPYPFPFESGNVELPADCEYVAPDSDPA